MNLYKEVEGIILADKVCAKLYSNMTADEIAHDIADYTHLHGFTFDEIKECVCEILFPQAQNTFDLVDCLMRFYVVLFVTFIVLFVYLGVKTDCPNTDGYVSCATTNK